MNEHAISTLFSQQKVATKVAYCARAQTKEGRPVPSTHLDATATDWLVMSRLRADGSQAARNIYVGS